MPNRAPSRPTVVISTACAAAAIAIAGCGGGEDSSSTSASTGGADDFVSQADAICSDVRAKTASLKPPTDNFESVAEYAAGGVAIIKPALKDLRALTPPANLREPYETYLGSIENQIQVEQRIDDAATAGDAKAVNALFRELKSEDTQREAAALGFTVCAQG